MVRVNNKKSSYTNVDGKLTNNQGKSVDPTDIADCLSQLTFVESIAIRRPSSSSSLRIYLLIRESNQGSKRLLGRLVHHQIDQKGLNSRSIQVYGMPIFPSCNESSSSFDWSLIDQLQSYQLINDVSSDGSTSQIEKDIIAAWSKYLNIPSDCIDSGDNLFELGGTLFLAGRIGHHLYGKNYPITIETIINNPTVKGLAASIETINSSTDKPDCLGQITRIDCGTNDRRSLLSWTQRWVFIHEQLLGAGHYYYLDVSYPIDKDYATIESILNKLVGSVELLRSFVRTRGSSHYLTIAPTRQLSIPVIKVANDGEAREAIDKKKETLDIITGDETFLFDVIFIETPEVNCFTLLIHHLIVDDWSYLLLEEKLFQMLQAYGRSETTQARPESPKSVEYVDYTVWITREFQRKTEIIDPLEEYWMGRLKDLPNCLIPVNFDENNLPKEPKVSGKHVLISLTDEETNGAKSLARSAGTTLDILAEAVIKVALYKLTGVYDTIIKRIISARLHPSSYEMIGHFNNMIYSRTVINPNDTFKAILRDFHCSWLKDFDHRGHPWINTVAQTNVEHCCPAGISVIGLPEQRFVDNDQLPIKIFKVDQFTQVSFELVTCIFGLHEGKLHYCLNYNEDLLESKVIDALVNTFEVFLRRVVTYSDRRIDQYFSIQPVYQVTQWSQESTTKSNSND